MSEIFKKLFGYVENKEYKTIFVWGSLVYCLIVPSFSIIFVFNRSLFYDLDFFKLLFLVVISNCILFIGCFMIASIRLSIKNDYAYIRKDEYIDNDKFAEYARKEIDKLKVMEDSDNKNKRFDKFNLKVEAYANKTEMRAKQFYAAQTDIFFTAEYLTLMLTIITWIIYAIHLVDNKPYSLDDLKGMVYCGLILYLSFMIGNFFKKRKLKLYYLTKLLFFMGVLLFIFFIIVLYRLLVN